MLSYRRYWVSKDRENDRFSCHIKGCHCNRVYRSILTSSSLQQIPTSPRAQIGSRVAHVMPGLQIITDLPILQLSLGLQVCGYLYQVPTSLIVVIGFEKAHVMIGILSLQIKQDKVNTADSAFIFLIILLISQNRWSGWSGRRRWSGLVFARKIARMILIQNI